MKNLHFEFHVIFFWVDWGIHGHRDPLPWLRPFVSAAFMKRFKVLCAVFFTS